MEHTQVVIAISGRAAQVFALLRLLATMHGEKTLGGLK